MPLDFRWGESDGDVGLEFGTVTNTKTGFNTNLYPDCSQNADAGLWILGAVSQSEEVDMNGT